MRYEIKRGDIFYIHRAPVIGHEQFSGRPAIIVSNDINNQRGETVEVVYLTTQPRSNMPTHVAIHSAKFLSTALCEQVTTVSVERIGNYYGYCTQEEMLEVDAAIMVSLGIGVCGAKERNRKSEAEPPRQFDSVDAVARLEAERDTYRTMYEQLLSKVVRTA